ncbi:MAG: (d)CMP kinase, partial [bacterium]|nr:(d)CMP kinase [bacterium]
MSNLIIAVDGPSGAGKSTVSKLLAEKLKLPYIDTGAMFRAVALKARQESIDLKDSKRLGDIAARADISFKSINGENHTFLDGMDVSDKIRNPEITH